MNFCATTCRTRNLGHLGAKSFSKYFIITRWCRLFDTEKATTSEETWRQECNRELTGAIVNMKLQIDCSIPSTSLPVSKNPYLLENVMVPITSNAKYWIQSPRSKVSWEPTKRLSNCSKRTPNISSTNLSNVTTFDRAYMGAMGFFNCLCCCSSWVVKTAGSDPFFM